MNPFRTIRLKLRSLGKRGAVKQEIDEELRFHIEQRTAENIAAGMAPKEAARAARRRFGNLQSIREDCREAYGSSFGETLLQDIRFGLRMLLKNPTFTSMAVLTLALGIGANTAIFSVVYGVLLRPLPYEQAGQLVRVSEDSGGGTVAGGVFLDWKENSALFDGLSLVRGTLFNLTDTREPERVNGWTVSANVLSVLGARPRFGRGFLPEEDLAGHDNHVALLADSLWKRRFGGDTNIVGRLIRLDGETYTVVGVLGPGALVWSDVEVIVPVVIHQDMHENRGTQMFGVFGRLKPGVSVRQAEVELRTIKERLQSRYPKWKADWQSTLIPFNEAIAGHMKPALLMILGGVLCVLLITCVNIANLLLVRGSARQREMAIRAAVGASRCRIVRQALTESVLLGLIGGGLGILLALWGVKLLPRLFSQFGDPISYFAWAVRLDWRILTFAFLLSLVTGIIFGLVPAFSASASDLNHTLNDGGRLSPGIDRGRIRNGLVVGEVALSLMLLVTMGLLLKSLVGLLHAPTGYISDNAMAMDISLSRAKYGDETLRARFFQQLFERLAVQPRIEAVASASTMPMHGSFTGQVFVEGRKDQPAEGCNFIPFDEVRGRYFRAMGIPIRRGRDLTEADYSANATPVCLLNDELVRNFFPGEDPLGRRIRLWGSVYEIVGITSNTLHDNLNHQKPEGRVYVSRLEGLPDNTESLIVRVSGGDPLSLAETVRKEILAIDPDQPVANVRTLDQDISSSVAGTRLTLQLLSVFGGLALLLAAIGLYGVMDSEVSQRTNEFGIRMALGAQRADLLKLVLMKGMRLALLGIVVGIAGTFAVTCLIRTQLYEVNTTDPLTLAAVALGLATVAFLACWMPARRATKIDPMEALRHE
jgi:putative ABC transport system permease protein